MVLLLLSLALEKHIWMLGAVLGSPVKDRQGCALQQIQGRGTKQVIDLGYPSHEEMLEDLELISMDQKRFSEIMCVCINT